MGLFDKEFWTPDSDRGMAWTVEKLPKLLEKAQKRAVKHTKQKMREQYQIAQVSKRHIHFRSGGSCSTNSS